jgi:hypothetical protein
VEVIWLLGRLVPDYKSIAQFRRMHREAVSRAGAELVRLARQVGLLRGEWVAIDGSRFRAVASAATGRERDAGKRYLDQLGSADEQDEVVIDPSAVAAALEKLKQDAEPEAHFMRTRDGIAPAYNVQTAVDAEHGIIVAQQVTTPATDNRSLLPTAEAAAEAGYWNGEQAECCEQQGIMPHVPANRAINNKGDGTLFDRWLFIYDEKTDSFRCPAHKTLHRKQLSKKDRCVMYAAAFTVCDNYPHRKRLRLITMFTIHRKFRTRPSERSRSTI